MSEKIAELAYRMRSEVTNVVGFHDLLDIRPPNDPIKRMEWESNFVAYSLALAKSVMELVEEFGRLGDDK